MSHHDHAKLARPRPTETIASVLLKDLALVTPPWEKAIIEHYEETALNGFKNAKKQLADKNDEWYNRWMPSFSYIEFPEHLTLSHEALYNYRRVCAATGRMTCNVAKARADGKRAFEKARDAFVDRVSAKMAEVFGLYAELTVDTDLVFQGLIRGTVAALDTMGSMLTVYVTVMTNYRYREHSANGFLTVYNQYPIRVVGLTVKGDKKHAKKISLGQAAMAISGRDAAKERRDAIAQRREEKAAKGRKIWGLKKRIELYDSIRYQYKNLDECAKTNAKPERVFMHTAAIAEICTKKGIVDPGSYRSAMDKIIEIREDIKRMKAEKP